MASNVVGTLMSTCSSVALLPSPSISSCVSASSPSSYTRRSKGLISSHQIQSQWRLRLGFGLVLNGYRKYSLQQQQFVLCRWSFSPLRHSCNLKRISAASNEEGEESVDAAMTSPRETGTAGSLGNKRDSRWCTGLAAMLAAATISASLNDADAELNKFEAETRGEFGVGSAAQYGSADLRGTVHANENFRRANFTSADMREADFSGCPFNGAYMEKAVAYKTNFSGADLSDTLMDRMVLNEANFTDALLVRAVLTRSDLGKAIIDGADFSDAVIDLQQKQALCRYANGVNPVTGMDTRKSLGCGTSRRSAYGTPSSPELSAPPEKLLSKDGYCDSATGLCKGTGTQ